MNIHGLDPVFQMRSIFCFMCSHADGAMRESSWKVACLLEASAKAASRSASEVKIWERHQLENAHDIFHDTGYYTVTAPRSWNMTPSAEQDGSLVFWKLKIILNLVLSAGGLPEATSKATCLGSSIRGQGCLRLLQNWQRRATPCKQVLAGALSLSLSPLFSLSNATSTLSNSTHIYWSAAIHQNCRSSTASPESATNCFHLLSSESQALKQREWRCMMWKSPTSTTPVIGWIQSLVETPSQFKKSF